MDVTVGKTLLAIDPGVHAVGAALWGDGALCRAAYVQNPNTHSGIGAGGVGDLVDALLAWSGGPADSVVVELPRHYPEDRGVKPNDLIDLAAVVGGIMATCGRQHTHYYPAQWKGQLPKRVSHARAMAELSQLERNVITPTADPALFHNVLDAVALGLFHLKKLRQRRTP